MKHRYVVGYSFGEGSGGMLFIWARHPGEIAAKYPELEVMADQSPPWMTTHPEVVRRMEESLTFDIDDEPTGWLAGLVAKRSQ